MASRLTSPEGLILFGVAETLRPGELGFGEVMFERRAAMATLLADRPKIVHDALAALFDPDGTVDGTRGTQAVPEYLESMTDDEVIFRNYEGKRFVYKQPRQVQPAETAVERADCDDIRVAAHALKGSAGNLSATALVSAARALEPGGLLRVASDHAEYFAAMKWTPWIKVVETAPV